MKNVFSLLLSILLIFSHIIQVSAYDIVEGKKIAVKNILINKVALKQIKNGEKYISAMDNLVEKIRKSEEKLSEVKSKISNVILKIESKQSEGKILSRTELEMLSILTYLDSRIAFAQLDIVQKSEVTLDEKIEKVLLLANNPDISESDKKSLENAVIKIQKNLLEKTKQSTETILGDFEKYFNNESKGDFEMNVNLDHKSAGKMKAEVKLSNYIIQNSNFDSRFQGHISAMVDALPKGQDAIQAEFSSFVDFISKDGQFYALVKDFKILNDQQLDGMSEIISTLKNISKENKYIKISNSKNTKAIETIKSFNPDKLFNDANVVFSQAMFHAYEKNGDVYSIIPTKYACDSLKVLSNKFDPFSPKVCTDSQYKKIIKNLLTQGELTLTLGSENVLKYSHKDNAKLDMFEVNIGFTDTEIKKINIQLIPNQLRFKNEQFIFNYEKNKKLDINFFANRGKMDVKFISLLDAVNNFSYIDHTAKLKIDNKTYNSNITLQNQSLSGKIKIQSTLSQYNYDSGKYEENGIEYFQVDISGNTNFKNKLNKLLLSFTGNDGKSEYFKGGLVYDLPRIKLYTHYKDESGKADFTFDAQWNTNNKNFDTFNASAAIKQNKKIYNEDTYEYIRSGDEVKVFDMNYTLNNNIISGKSQAYKDNSTVFLVDTNGTYQKDALQINNKIVFNDDFFFFGQISKARDSSRISDINNIAVAIEMYFQDNGEYPSLENFDDAVHTYLSQTPQDPKGNIEVNNCKFGYIYAVGTNKKGTKNGSYKLSTCLESTANAYKAENDDGTDVLRYEKGNYLHSQTLKSKYINKYSTWVKQDSNQGTDPILHINFGYDNTGNNINSQLHIDAMYENTKVFDMNIKNTGTIEYKNINIPVPTNSKPLDDIINSDY